MYSIVLKCDEHIYRSGVAIIKKKKLNMISVSLKIPYKVKRYFKRPIISYITAYTHIT